MPTPPLGVVSSATYSHLLQRGSNRSTELRGELSSKPPANNHHRVSFWHFWCRGYPRLAFSAFRGSCPALSLLELYMLLKITLTALPPLTAQASLRVTVLFYSSCKDSNFIIFLLEFIILIMKQLPIWKRKKPNTSKRMVSIVNLFYFMQNTL